MLLALLGKVIPLLLKFIVPPITYALGRIVLNIHQRIDRLPAIAKQITVVALAFVVSTAAARVGVVLPDVCGGVSGGQITEECWTALSSPTFLNVLATTALGAAGAFLLHALKKQNPYTGPKPVL